MREVRVGGTDEGDVDVGFGGLMRIFVGCEGADCRRSEWPVTGEVGWDGREGGGFFRVLRWVF